MEADAGQGRKIQVLRQLQQPLLHPPVLLLFAQSEHRPQRPLRYPVHARASADRARPAANPRFRPARRRVNVGVVTDFYFPWIGGPSTVIANITQGLSSRGHEVHLLAPSPDGPGGDEREAAVSVTRAPTVPLPVGYRLRIART